MNPSAADWIPKFLSRFNTPKLIKNHPDEIIFYKNLRTTGFIYGISNATAAEGEVNSIKLTAEELTKVNLFHTLLYIYFEYKDNATIEEAIPEIVSFYKKLEKRKSGFIKKLSLTQSPSRELEGILSTRLQETNAVFKMKTTTILTYAMLLIDALAFRNWLLLKDEVKEYARELEHLVISCCLLALASKKRKNKYDVLLIALFASSSEATAKKGVSEKKSLEEFPQLKERHWTEKKYILDLCCIAVWDDFEMDSDELDFLKQLTDTLHFPPQELNDSLMALSEFSEKQTTTVQLFEYSNPVKLFYKQSAATVKLLILRNKNRLLKELSESGELLVLLSHSTVRELSSEEKVKVREQLLDVCKTIPSLTIFLLPGGTVLLPLMVKFIPKLLPSAFNENRIEKKK